MVGFAFSLSETFAEMAPKLNLFRSLTFSGFRFSSLTLGFASDLTVVLGFGSLLLEGVAVFFFFKFCVFDSTKTRFGTGAAVIMASGSGCLATIP